MSIHGAYGSSGLHLAPLALHRAPPTLGLPRQPGISRLGVKHGNMTYGEFDSFCRTLTATTYVVQWGGSHVWKVGGKVFAIASGQKDQPRFSFKVSDIAYEMLKDQSGLRPAPYLASRGMKWIQHFAKPGLSDAALRDYFRQSHFIVSQSLSKKKRIELGLEAP